MTKPNEIYPDAITRSNRIIGAYLSALCSVNGATIFTLSREELKAMLDIERIQHSRLRQFYTDVAPWFPAPRPRYVYSDIVLATAQYEIHETATFLDPYQVDAFAFSEQRRIQYLMNLSLGFESPLPSRHMCCPLTLHRANLEKKLGRKKVAAPK